MSVSKKTDSSLNGHGDIKYSALAVNNTDSDTDSDCYYTASLNKQGGKKSESIKLVKIDSRGKRSETNSGIDQLVRVAHPSIKTTLYFWTGTVFLVVLVAVIVTVFVVPSVFPSGDSSKTPLHSKSPPWSNYYGEYGTAALRVVDIDDDGRSDIVLSLVREANANDLYNMDSLKRFCKRFGTTPPCVGAVVGIRGYDGVELWRTHLDSELFEIMCSGIDVNKDGKDDCLVAGRKSTVAAINPKNGTLLWEMDDRFSENLWNIYMPLVLDDLDGDGIRDLLIAHGGDPAYPAKILDRKAGRIFLVSGATGKILGRRYYAIPQSKETYMSPVLHHRKDGAQVILFGSGGETVPGSLYGVYLADFYRYLYQLGKDFPVPKTVLLPKSKKWGRLLPDKNGIYEIYRAKLKGMMVPPVLVDMNGDGVKDMMVTSFEGDSMLLDGETLEIVWKKTLSGYETYSTPAPGYFNGDDVLDFATHWSYGAWDRYNSSIAIIQDGTNGSIIWSLETSGMEMSSDLVARTTVQHMDAYILRVLGRQSKLKAASESKMSERRKRHGPHPGDTGHSRPVCSDEDVASSTVEVFLITRMNTQNLIKVAELEAEKYYYNLTADGDIIGRRHAGHEGSHDDESEVEGKLCTVLKPTERVTGAVGDLDGDGNLDVVLNLGSFGQINNKGGNYIRMRLASKIAKINLADVLKSKSWTKVSAVTNLPDQQKDFPETLVFQSASLQPWTGYLGTGDNIYED